ncbi:1,4-alpha-glucan branching protein [Nocardia sp. NPDC051030]|uniref:maltokinase N-terminal cap-like domain-containing protein n=1 Tax=Nocardia sp. NPDC051030 TaxID=3155162 RepID=UPI0034390464
MAIIHSTTMTPGKLDLLAQWLPTRHWFAGGQSPSLTKSGGFRLDDPAGEVGIEVMIVTDTSEAEPVTYLVPMTYRGAPLDGADAGLIGTSEHGVLGTRWIYDAAHDPVFVEQAVGLLTGEADPQDQNISGIPDSSVHIVFGEIDTPAKGFTDASVRESDSCSEIELGVGDSPETDLLRIHRVLTGSDTAELPCRAGAQWTTAAGALLRGVVLSATR